LYAKTVAACEALGLEKPGFKAWIATEETELKRFGKHLKRAEHLVSELK
jgi:hypothetical protein